MQFSSCGQRLTRDVSELFARNFRCSASHMSVIQTADSLNEPGSITLDAMFFEGPYRGGRFAFCFHIPPSYPFRAVEVWATQPVWHPNIDVRTGRVAIPMEWSPVLTLSSFALAVQMVMLEPSPENALNLEALSLFTSQPALFDAHAQETLLGGWFQGVHFENVCFSRTELMHVAPLMTGSKRCQSDDSSERSRAQSSSQGHALTNSDCFVPTPSKRARTSSYFESEDSDTARSTSPLFAAGAALSQMDMDDEDDGGAFCRSAKRLCVAPSPHLNDALQRSLSISGKSPHNVLQNPYNGFGAEMGK